MGDIKKVCVTCENNFKADRNSKKYCSDKCRKKAYRERNPEKIREENRRNRKKGQ